MSSVLLPISESKVHWVGATPINHLMYKSINLATLSPAPEGVVWWGAVATSGVAPWCTRDLGGKRNTSRLVDTI